MVMTKDKNRTTPDVVSPIRFTAKVGVFRQYAPHTKNINSAAGRANAPKYGPSHPHNSAIVENMMRVMDKVFSR
jgi:hypothetical protein